MDQLIQQTLADLIAEKCPALTLPTTRINYVPKSQSFLAHFPMIISNQLRKKGIQSSPEDVITTFLEPLHEQLGEYFKIEGKGKMVEFTPTNTLIQQIVTEIWTSPETGVHETPQKVAIDYSSPNIAKDMHVGHLRSTIIGDALANLLESLGHQVTRINHIGDFGTQFGMLLQQLEEKLQGSSESLELSDLQGFYRQAKARFEEEPEFKMKALQQVQKFQSREPEAVKLWTQICEASRHSYEEIYRRLEIKGLEEVGESFYQDLIPEMVHELKEKNLLTLQEGRWVMYLPGIKEPLTVVKSDGTYGYDATDLAAARYRLQTLKMDRVIYVVDHGQSLHFRQIFLGAQMAGWVQEHQSLEHVDFGLVVGEDGKRLRSSSGETYRLIDLLEEAVKATRRALEEGKEEHSLEELEEMTPKVAYSAVKYADLSMDRKKNYQFSLPRMLNLKGNTAMYLLYSYVRIRSIFRKVPDFEFEKLEPGSVPLVIEDTHPAERILYLYLTQWEGQLQKVAESLQPHHLCQYLYDLVVLFNRFYENFRCLHFDEEGKLVKQVDSRLVLISLILQIMEQGFQILGLKPVAKI